MYIIEMFIVCVVDKINMIFVWFEMLVWNLEVTSLNLG